MERLTASEIMIFEIIFNYIVVLVIDKLNLIDRLFAFFKAVRDIEPYPNKR
jgi:hypothetical protein